MNREVVIIGGGVAGLEAAGQLSKAGIGVTLYEKEQTTGGHLNNWNTLFPDRRKGSQVKDYLTKNIESGSVNILTGSTIEKYRKSDNRFVLTTNTGNEVKADAVIVATGFDLFRIGRKEEYGWGIYDNVIGSDELEIMLGKKEIVLANGKKPERIGIVHCVGSRDEKVGNVYCSKLCCVTAVKQAIEIKELNSDIAVFCFYMDMRMGGAMYEELYRESQEKWGVNFIRGKVSEAGENIDGKLVLKVEDTLAGRPLKMSVDMLVLMAGMEISEGSKKVAANFALHTGENRFFSSADNHFGSNISNVDGLFYAGTCTAPMNITETISHARSAVIEVMNYFEKSKK